MHVTEYLKAVLQRSFQKHASKMALKSLSSRNSNTVGAAGLWLRQTCVLWFTDVSSLQERCFFVCACHLQVPSQQRRRVRRQTGRQCEMFYSSGTFHVSLSISSSLCVCLSLSTHLRIHCLSHFPHFGNKFRNKQAKCIMSLI